MRVTVADVAEPPEFSVETASRTIAENTTTGVAIGDPVTATDPDTGDTPAYTLGGTDANFFDIDASTGQLQTQAALDYETRSSYTVTVTASDGALTATVDVTVTVTNIDEAGTVTLSTDQPPARAEITAALTDPDEGVSGAVWQWERSSDGNTGWVGIGTSSPSYTPVDGDVGYHLRATASYTDGHGPGKTAQAASTQAVQAGANRPPEFDSATAAREVPENTEAGENIGAPVTANDPDNDSLTYTLGGVDLDSFDIDSASGQIQTKPGVTYDHETKSSYSVTVKADDKNGGIATIDVTITVTDVDEPLTVNGQTSVGYPENSDGQVATYSATDPDNDQITWSLSGDDAGDFSIGNTGELTFQTAPDHEAPADDNTDNRYELTVEASDGSVKGTLDVAVTVTDVNEPPGFSVETASRTIAENTTTGVAIGAPVTASDPDTADTPAYTLGGTDANFFDIDTSSGQLRTKAALDYEVKNTYQISVSVRDGKNAEGNPDAADDATITVTITVTNVEEPGKVTLNLLQPQVSTGLTTIVTDPDGGVRGMTWEWESSSDNKNTWTPISGAVSGTYFPVDADVGNYLRVTVSYTDAEGSNKSAQAVSDMPV